jgi:DNA-binding CsgD family transcriptional regulator
MMVSLGFTSVVSARQIGVRRGSALLADQGKASLINRIRHLGDVLKSTRLPVLAGMLWWGFYFLLNWRSGLIFREGFWGVTGVDRLSFGVTVLCLVLLLLLLHRRRIQGREAWLKTVLALSSLLALATLVPALQQFSFSAGLSSVCMGLSMCLGYYLVGRMNTSINDNSIIVVSATQAAGGVLLFSVARALPTYPLIVVLTCMILSSTLLLDRVERRFSQTASAAGASSAPPPLSQTVGEPPRPLVLVDTTPKQLIVLIFLIGFSDSVTRSHVSQYSAQWSQMPPFEGIGTAIACLLLISIYLFMQRRSLLEQSFVFVVPLAAAGIILNPLLSDVSPLPIILHHSGYVCLLFMLCYYAVAFRASGERQNAAFLMAAFILAIESGILSGSFVPSQFVTLVSSMLLYLLLLVLMIAFFLQRGRYRNMEEKSKRAFIHDYAERHQLTQREEEVLTLLAARKPYNRIASEMYISMNTVKTHVRKIYEKTDVSSRDELLERMGLN